ncbi:hypothetical protein [Streptomyces sp. NPDC048361]|uniref:hypothetical protein n=1 Tax=Streptomyces sp. NPDC048361 TaxID=3154720 RepID=UPI0034338BDF
MGQAAEQGYRVVEGHRLEELCVGALNGGHRAWGQVGAGVGDAQSFGAGVGRVDFTLDQGRYPLIVDTLIIGS